jgi:diguanylate cyclase (GGDEF)-like protein
VETEAALRESLCDFKPGLIISDFSLPHFSGLDALSIARAEAPEIPFIFVSGTIGEERAIEALKHGAVDYILKSNLMRLGPAVRRALDEAAANAEHRNAQKHIQRLTYFDPLTGLARRALFCERIGQKPMLGDAPAGLAIVVFDIERLGVINDSLGRYTGDLLLQEIASRLRRHFGDERQLAHLEGGTFAALMGRAVTDASERQLHQRITGMFAEPLPVAGQSIPVFVKCGIAFVEGTQDPDILLQNAEAALHKARASGVRHLRHHPGMNSEVAERLALEHRLRGAMDRKEFTLLYQPQVERGSGRVLGAEALIRWVDPQRGMVSPAGFLPMLESTGLIVGVGEWVLQRAGEDCRRWASLGLGPMRIAVNVSPVQLNRKDFAQQLFALTELARWGRFTLEVEITEQALMEEGGHHLQALETLRAAGVCVAVDEFGTVYSSLSRLSQLPVDVLKIDASFTQRLSNDPSSHAVIATIVALAQSLGLRTIAEGVETAEQVHTLETLGCSELQGYLFGAPVSATEFEMLMTSQMRSTA